MSDPYRPRPLGLTASTGADGTVTVLVAGEIDMSSTEDLGALLTRVLTSSAPARVVLDMAQVRFMDSTGINVLVQAYRLAQQTAGTITVINPNPMIVKVMRITGILPIFTAGSPPP